MKQRPANPNATHIPGALPDTEPHRQTQRRPLISWSRQTALLAISVSLFIHVLAAFYLVGTPGQTGAVAGADAGAAAEFAVLNQVEFDQITSSELASELEFEASFDDPAASEAFTDPGADADIAAIESGDLGELGGATTTGDSTLGGGAASFFGVAAQGTRFAYVVDVSGSMDETRMQALIRALTGSIGGLLDEARYVVAMYNNDVTFAGREAWNRTDDASQGRTIAALRVFADGGNGGTQPLPAFERVFAMRPKPDAIYFMTDGVFGDESNALLIAAAIRRMNLESGKLSAIHCITFIDDGSADVMQRIAEQSGGTYTHVGPIGGSPP